jgi:hypothetical protein
MDFIMRAWQKSEGTSGGGLLFRLLVAFLCMQPLPGMAETQGLNIRYVTGAMFENTYRVNADIDYHFSAETEKALTHGVPLQFDTLFKVKKHRRWLWDKTISTVMLKFKLQYHPLSGYYLVTNIQNGERQQFLNLDNATGYLGKLKNYPLIARNALDADNGEYYGLINVKLDIQSLPAPLRPLAYLSTQWRLSSPTYAWGIHP